jgi:hypothetical protein
MKKITKKSKKTVKVPIKFNEKSPDDRVNKIIKKNKKIGLKESHTNYNIMKGLKNFKFKFKKKSSLIVCNLELINGDLELFVVSVQAKTFKLLGGQYIVHEQYLKYNRTLKLWEGKYHQGCSLPIDQTIPITEIKDNISNSNNKEVADIVTNVDPMILVNFVKTEIIQKVFSGGEIGNIFGFIKIMLILILVGVGIAVAVLIGGVI